LAEDEGTDRDGPVQPDDDPFPVEDRQKTPLHDARIAGHGAKSVAPAQAALSTAAAAMA
jgi:hypothetical protein